MNFDEFGILVDNGDGTYTFVSPDPDVADVTFTSEEITTGAIALDKVFSITLTGNVNYLDIPDLKDYNKIEVNSTKKVDIKGLKSDGVPDGFTIVVHNVSTHEHKYKKNQNAAPATYRFDSEDIKVKKKAFIWWTWNSIDSRWNAQNNH